MILFIMPSLPDAIVPLLSPFVSMFAPVSDARQNNVRVLGGDRPSPILPSVSIRLLKKRGWLGYAYLVTEESPMRSRPNPQRIMLAIVDPGNGCPETIRCGGSRK